MIRSLNRELDVTNLGMLELNEMTDLICSYYECPLGGPCAPVICNGFV
ncbi:hypothetical protein J1TS5_09090 [Paenibacillus macerans]|nr:hypothetical protein J1TS5_09090 [Paenibacillus macerans]